MTVEIEGSDIRRIHHEHEIGTLRFIAKVINVPIVLLSDVPTVKGVRQPLKLCRSCFLSRCVPIVLLSDVLPTIQRSQITVEVLQVLFIVKGRSDCVAE